MQATESCNDVNCEIHSETSVGQQKKTVIGLLLASFDKSFAWNIVFWKLIVFLLRLFGGKECRVEEDSQDVSFCAVGEYDITVLNRKIL